MEESMQAQHLAAYFEKRIAKPLPYDVHIERKQGGVIYWAYELEVTAVDDDMLHMMVTLKGVHDGRRWLQKQNLTCGDIAIPMNDEDTVTLLLAGC
jgi:hypothetical protein